MQVRRGILLNTPHLDTATGQTIQLTKAVRAPMPQCKVEFAPVQSGVGDPSPSNIRPISGWTGLTVNVSPTASGGTQYPINWQTVAGTVYRGYIDLANGELVVDMGYREYDGSSDETWNMESISIGKNFYINIPDATLVYDPDVVCSAAISRKSGASYMQGQCFISASKNFNFAAQSIATNVSELRMWLSSNPIQVAYKLRTPITYHISAQTVKTLGGTNNIWSNANGNLTITYWTH